MSFSTENEETSCRAHLFCLGRDLCAVFIIEPSKGSSRFKHSLVGGLGSSGGCRDKRLLDIHSAHFTLCHKLRVTAKHNIRTASSHIGGDGNGAKTARLRNDLRLLFVLLCVKHVMRDTNALKHVR